MEETTKIDQIQDQLMIDSTTVEKKEEMVMNDRKEDIVATNVETMVKNESKQHEENIKIKEKEIPIAKMPMISPNTSFLTFPLLYPAHPMDKHPFPSVNSFTYNNRLGGIDTTKPLEEGGNVGGLMEQQQHQQPPQPMPMEGGVKLETMKADTAIVATTPSYDPSHSTRSKARPGLRKGKWSVEESNYAMRLTYYFKRGLLPLKKGTMLRLYLADKLNCEPMRITKKFTGDECIGKQVYRPREPSPQNEVRFLEAQEELVKLEEGFYRRIEQTLPPIHPAGATLNTTIVPKKRAKYHHTIMEGTTTTNEVGRSEEGAAETLQVEIPPFNETSKGKNKRGGKRKREDSQMSDCVLVDDCKAGELFRDFLVKVKDKTTPKNNRGKGKRGRRGKKAAIETDIREMEAEPEPENETPCNSDRKEVKEAASEILGEIVEKVEEIEMRKAEEEVERSEPQTESVNEEKGEENSPIPEFSLFHDDRLCARENDEEKKGTEQPEEERTGPIKCEPLMDSLLKPEDIDPSYSLG